MSLSDRGPIRRCFAVSALFALLFALLVSPVAATDKSDSLDWVPEDASFYSSTRRMKEQVEIVWKSNAMKKVLAMPAVKMGLAELETQLEDPAQPAGMVKSFFELPENEQLLQLLADMHSEEIVIYGDNNWVDAFQLLREVNKVTNRAQAEQVQRLQRVRFDEDGELDEDFDSGQKAIIRSYFDLLGRNLDRCKIPTTVIAYRLTEKVPATTQLKRLEVLAKLGFAHVPELKEAISRKKIDGVEYLTFTFEAKYLPWEEMPIEDIEKEKGEYKKVIDHLKSLKAVANIGVWDDWLVVSIAADDEHLATLGQGKTIRERVEFAKLAAYKDRRLTSIAYASKPLMTEVNNWKRQIDDLVEMVHIFMPLAPIPEPLQQRIAGDVKELGEDIKEGLPDPGATLNFSYLTDNGFDFRSYTWATGSPYDSSKPLTILNHVGGSPILAIAARGKYDPKQYDTVKKWVKKGHKYFEELALPQFSDRERKQYEEVAEHAYPLIRRIDSTTAKKLIPSLADGQSALVIDAKLANTQWVREQPRAAAPLAVPEPALVIGVSDAALLKEAMVDYHTIANDAIKVAREISPDEVPPFTIPSLLEKSIKGGNMYYHPLPEVVYKETDLDRRLLPNLGLSKTVGSFAVSEQHTSRLLKSTPLAATGPLAKSDRKAAMAVYLNWPALVDAATPWVDYGFSIAAMEGEFGRLPPEDRGSRDDVSDVKLPAQAAEILAQVHTGLDVLKCFRGFEGVTYQDDDVWVSEAQMKFEDLKP